MDVRNGLFHMACCLSVVFCAFACTDNPDARFQKLNRQGIECYARRAYHEALAVWQEARKLKPKDAFVLSSIGNTYLKLAALPMAVAVFEEAVKLNPDRPDICCELIRLLILSGNLAGAETRLEQLEKPAQHWPQVEILRGDIHLLKNCFDLAEQAYSAAASHTVSSLDAQMKLALCYVSQGKMEAARKAYATVADAQPSSAPLLLQMHHYWNLLDNPQKAEAVLLQAIAVEPENLSLRWALAQFYFAERRFDAARTGIEFILKAYPENRSASIFLTEILMATHELKAAETILGKLSSQNENDSGISLLQGKLQLLLNSPILAVDSFKRALHIDADLIIAHYLLGLAYLADGRYHLARLSLNEVLKRDPLFTEAELLMAQLYYHQGEDDLALAHVERIVEREKECYRAHLLSGHVYQSTGQYDKSVLSYVNAQKLLPDSLPILYYRAVVAETAGDFQLAASLYEKSLQIKPGLADAALRYGRLLIQTHQTDSALYFFKKAIDKDAKNAYLHYVLGEIFLAAGHPLNARNAFQEAIDLSPKLISAYDQLAHLAETAGDDQSHKMILLACTENNPKHVRSYLELARLYRMEWRSDKAIGILERGLSHNPGDAWLSNSLAWIYLEQGQQLNKALELAQTAYEALPEAGAISDTLGWAYHLKGFSNQALWVLKEAACRAPDNNILLYHLGAAQLAAGSVSEAETNLKKALALNLARPYKEEAEALLEKIRRSAPDEDQAQWKPEQVQVPGDNAPIEEFNAIIDNMKQENTPTDLETFYPADGKNK